MSNKIYLLFAGVLLSAVVGWSLSGNSSNSETEVVIYTNPGCMCCMKWASHLEKNGFNVVQKKDRTPDAVKTEYGVTDDLQSCHTALVEGYVIEGHVPAEQVKRLLSENPDATGLAVPGMPVGSPGMEGNYSESYEVFLFDDAGNRSVIARY